MSLFDQVNKAIINAFREKCEWDNIDICKALFVDSIDYMTDADLVHLIRKTISQEAFTDLVPEGGYLIIYGNYQRLRDDCEGWEKFETFYDKNSADKFIKLNENKADYYYMFRLSENKCTETLIKYKYNPYEYSQEEAFRTESLDVEF